MKKTYAVALGVGCAAALSTGSAMAAGSGYGGGGANGGSTPAGFTSVQGVYSVPSSKGGTVGSGTTHATVPAGAAEQTLEVVFYKGSTTTARKHHSKYLDGDGVLKAFGVGLFVGPTATVTSEPVTVTITGSNIRKGDHLAVYNTRTHEFQAVAASFSKGKVTFKIERGQSVAIFS